MAFLIRQNIASSQSKGCALFLQVGTSALVWNPRWAKHRDVAYIHAEIDTPRERLRIGFYGKQIVNSRRRRKFILNIPSQKQNNGYRSRWLKN